MNTIYRSMYFHMKVAAVKLDIFDKARSAAFNSFMSSSHKESIEERLMYARGILVPGDVVGVRSERDSNGGFWEITLTHNSYSEIYCSK